MESLGERIKDTEEEEEEEARVHWGQGKAA